MTNDELAVIRQINGEEAVYDAHLSGYDVIMPVQIHQDGTQCAVKAPHEGDFLLRGAYHRYDGEGRLRLGGRLYSHSGTILIFT